MILRGLLLFSFLNLWHLQSQAAMVNCQLILGKGGSNPVNFASDLFAKQDFSYAVKLDVALVGQAAGEQAAQDFREAAARNLCNTQECPGDAVIGRIQRPVFRFPSSPLSVFWNSTVRDENESQVILESSLLAVRLVFEAAAIDSPNFLSTLSFRRGRWVENFVDQAVEVLYYQYLTYHGLQLVLEERGRAAAVLNTRPAVTWKHKFLPIIWSKWRQNELFQLVGLTPEMDQEIAARRIVATDREGLRAYFREKITKSYEGIAQAYRRILVAKTGTALLIAAACIAYRFYGVDVRVYESHVLEDPIKSMAIIRSADPEDRRAAIEVVDQGLRDISSNPGEKPSQKPALELLKGIIMSGSG
jgi:hypothetical protein